MSFPPPEIEESFTGDAVLLADASVEGDDIASMLRARGFSVIDVPLALLEARVVTEAPRVLVLDVDQPGAIDKALRIRELEEGKAVEIICVGDPLRAAELADVSLHDNVFERPVDVPRLVDRVASIALPAGPGFPGRGTTPPPMYAPRASVPPSPDSVPPISELPRPDDPLEVGAFLDPADEGGAMTRGLLIGPVPLSPELTKQIVEAEARIRATIDRTSSQPRASEEGDCILPVEMLAMLDEPMDASEEILGTGAEGSGTGARVGSSSGASSIGLSPAAMTPVPRPVTASGDATQALSAPVRPPSSTGATSAEMPPISPPEATLATLADPMPVSGPARSMTPLGLRLGDILGWAPQAAAPPQDLAKRSPFDTLRGAASLAQGGTRAPGSTDVGLGSAAPAGVTMGSEAVIAEMGQPPQRAEDLRSMPPLSPPVRFREPRELAEGRSFDLRTLPPPTSAQQPPSTALPAPGSVTSRDGPVLSRPATSAGRAGPVPSGRSPAAHSVGGGRLESSAIPMVFGEGDGLRPIARAIASRVSGAVTLTTSAGVRRVVLQEGDVVTAASEVADESLVAFLAGKGDLDRDAAARLAGRLPPSGRHAGAALIAQGFLAQDDLWPVLRAHAQWLVGRAMLSGPGSLEIEEEPPGRLRQEPAVFGGSTGAEVFVETARRVLAPPHALASLGGPGARLDLGPRRDLLAECALSEDEQAVVESAPGRSVADVCPDPASELLAVLRALVELEVLTATQAPVAAAAPRRDEPDPIDDDAIRQRVRARIALVREGDYFALLGVGRSATSYEVKRAYLEARRAFEPSRILTAKTADLYEDVRLVLEVIDEAYEILRDQHRRDRYRRAIEAGPPD